MTFFTFILLKGISSLNNIKIISLYLSRYVEYQECESLWEV